MKTDRTIPEVGKALTSKATKVIVLTTAMFTFISFWRAAAVVFGDIGSTVYYIGGIVEQFIGHAAPYFILAVMLFSFAVRSVYIESCGIFVRGGVYRVVKTALNSWMAKISVSALMFDYVLTGPISGVSAGQYFVGFLNDIFKTFNIGIALDKDYISMLVAILITLYFWRENVKGIEESSDKSFKIFILTWIMGIIIIGWSVYTLLLKDQPFFSTLPKYELNLSDHAYGWLSGMDWIKAIPLISVLVAFGHSILAMSGEESLAQVYREIESPKLKNLKRAALIIFISTLVLTPTISFLGMMLIPDDIRQSQYIDNYIGGITMFLYAPLWFRLILNAFVVVVGVLILSAAVNTSIIGSNGVLNRVAEDKVLTDWFRKLHKKYGTTHRMFNLIAIMQIVTIILSRGDVLLLGEAYAFGVVWSFVFKALAMVVLRFKDKSPREWRVPINLRVGSVTLPIGLFLTFLVLLSVALINLFTKPIATVSGFIFTGCFFVIFTVSDYLNKKKLIKENTLVEEKHEKYRSKHLEYFNLEGEETITPESIGSENPDRVLVGVRDPNNLVHLQKILEETDTDKTDVIVFIGRVFRDRQNMVVNEELEPDERKLFSEVVNVSEKIGKPVIPLIVPTNNAFYSVVNVAHSLKAREIVLGVSAKYRTDVQLQQLALLWGTIQSDESEKITIRIISRDTELKTDL